MDRKTALNLAWALTNLFRLPSEVFRFPRKEVAEGQEKPAPRFGVVTASGAAFGSIDQVQEWFETVDLSGEVRE